FLPCGSHQQHVQIVRESMSNVEQCHIHVGDDAGHICDGDGGWIWISWPRCCTLAGNSDGRWIGKSLGCCQHRKYGDNAKGEQYQYDGKNDVTVLHGLVSLSFYTHFTSSSEITDLQRNYQGIFTLLTKI